MRTFPHFFSLLVCSFIVASCNNSGGNDSIEKSAFDPNTITDRTSSFSHISELEIYEADYQIKNGDFEEGNLDGWYLENRTQAFKITADDTDIWDNPVAKTGTYFLGIGKNNYEGTSTEALKGKIRSSLFKVGGNGIITFSLAGSANEKAKCTLMLYNPNGTDTVLKTFNNTRLTQGGLSGFILVPYLIQLDIAQYKDRLCYFVLDDQVETDFGFISIDSINTYHVGSEENSLFFTKLASYCTPISKSEALENATLKRIELNNTLKTEYNYNEDFTTDTLLVYGIYSNHMKAIINKNSISINKSAFKKGVPGTYEIKIMVTGTAIGTKFNVTVHDENDPIKGTKEFKTGDELLVFGDSQMAMWNNLKSDIGVFDKVSNVAVGGSTTDDWMDKIDLLCTKNAPFVLINLGGNDIRNRAKSPSYIANNVETMINKFKTQSPNSHLYMFEMSCGNASYYNYYDAMQETVSLYKELEKKHSNFTVISYKDQMFDDEGMPDSNKFREDKLHINPSAYPILASAFRKYIKK